ncbi:hypothetical protein LCGC14_0995020 [marine sediment metagenome]|uniref:Uncharacterized protein n=1 Tax=marine sediment metagenome TaxID=412755 RepID=A0A0F9N4N5_9ZZZZ
MTFSSIPSLLGFKLMLRAAQRRRGTYLYVFPSIWLAKELVWKHVNFLAWNYTDSVLKINHTNMTVYLENGSKISILNFNNSASLLGQNPTGVIIFGSLFAGIATDLILPVRINKGWIIFEDSLSMRIKTF